MWQLIAWGLASLPFTIGACAAAEDKHEDDSQPPDNLYQLKLSDGSLLKIQALVRFRDNREVAERQTADAIAVLQPKGVPYSHRGPVIWHTQVTSVDYAPETAGYYVLVKVTGDRFFMFFTWSGEYCVLEKGSGKVIEKGDRDSVLKRYGELQPLKLLMAFPSVGRVMTDHEFEEFKRQEREAEKQEKKLKKGGT